MLDIFTCRFLITCVTSFSTNVSCFSAFGFSEFKDTNANVCHLSPRTRKVSSNDLLHLFLQLSVWSPRSAAAPSAELPVAVALPSLRHTLYLREQILSFRRQKLLLSALWYLKTCRPFITHYMKGNACKSIIEAL